jgi:hypothetical protein
MILNANFFSKQSAPALLMILAAGFIVYANTFQAPFVLDDKRSIIQNDVIQNLDNYYANRTGFDFVPNRFVVYLTFALNYHFGGLDVTGYHVVNLLIHLLTALLVYALLRLTFRTPYFQDRTEKQPIQVEEASGTVQSQRNTVFPQSSPQSQSDLPATFSLQPSTLIPLFGALIFVVHPVQTQAVTYIVQRMTSLATMFYLLSITLYVQARLAIENSECRMQNAEYKNPEAGIQHSEKKTRRTGIEERVKSGVLMAGSVLTAVLAMKTKEIAFTLPLAVVLYEVCFFRGAWKRRMFYLLPLLATLPIVPLTVIDIGGSAGDILSDGGDKLRVGSSMSRLDYLFTQFRVIVTYLRLLILPINQNLDYDYPIYTNFFSPPVFLSFLLLAATFATAVYLFRRSDRTRIRRAKNRPDSAAFLRLIAFGIFWFFLTLTVESSLVPIRDVIFEHRLYLPLFGATTVMVTVYYLLARRVSAGPAGGKLFILAATLLVLGLGFATYQRNHVWGNAIRLWQDVVTKSPNKGRALNNLGVALEEAGSRPEAFKILSQAIAVDPDYYRSYYNLANLYLVSDRPDEAMPLLQHAIKLRSDFTEAYVKLGAALMRGGQFREVILFLNQNLDRVKDNAEARFYLGAAYAFLGNREAAMRELEFVSQRDAALAADLAGLLGMQSNHGFPHGH